MFRLFALALVATTLFTTPARAQSEVGFEKLSIPDGAGAPIEVGVWYPRDAASNAALPLIVMSHGNGGSYSGNADTAQALARAGFVAAALTHTGDNYRDMSRAADVAERPRQLHVLIEHMITDWTGHGAVDPGRVGAFGFSSGGFTVLAAAGGEPDLTRVIEHCRDNPRFYDCRLIGQHPPSADAIPAAWAHDRRIRAVVAAAPALGYTFTREGLSGVTQPVQLWRAENDRVLPHPFYAQAVHDGLPTPPEYHVVFAADHFDFLPPCSPELQAAAPVICQTTPGLDRATFHETFNAEVVAFFQRNLAAP
jgi:predicted dienelactone hydrolase